MAGGGLRHRPHGGDLVREGRLSRQQFREVQAGNLRGNGAEGTTVLARGLWLGVIRIELRAPARKPDHDDGG